MTVYSVQPGSKTIRVSDGRTLVGEGDISWGQDNTLGGFYLCQAILLDIYHDAPMARRYAQRMKWRSIRNWKADQPGAITDQEVRNIVDAIRAVEDETRPMVERMAREKPQFVTDRPGPGQQYDSNPELKPNPTRSPDNEHEKNAQPQGAADPDRKRD